MNNDPKRLFEDDSGPLGDLLRAARADALDSDRVARVRAGMARALAVASVGVATTAGSSAASSAGGAAAGASTATKWGGALVAKFLAASATVKVGVIAAAVCTAGTGALVTTRYVAEKSHVSSMQRRATPPAVPNKPVSGAAEVRTPEAAAPALVPGLDDLPPPPLPPVLPTVANAKPSNAPVVVSASAPRIAVTSTAATVASEPKANALNPAPLREGALLLQARAAIETDPAHALELLRQHEAQFPKSQLVPERERIAAEATMRLRH